MRQTDPKGNLLLTSISDIDTDGMWQQNKNLQNLPGEPLPSSLHVCEAMVVMEMYFPKYTNILGP